MNFFTQLFIYLVASYISYRLTPKPTVVNAEPSTDYQAPTAEEGRPIPVVFGTCWVKGANVVWYGDVETVPIYG
jgi:hypothetical protein